MSKVPRNQEDREARQIRKSREKIERDQRLASQAFVDSMTVTSIDVKPDTILIFLDESGDFVKSASNSIFCLGGVAIRGSDYASLKDHWVDLKKSLFNLNPDQLCHATKVLPELTKDQEFALERFLAEAKFQALLSWDSLDHLLASRSLLSDHAATLPLSVIQQQIQECYGWGEKNERWYIETSNKQNWRMMRKLLYTGHSMYKFPEDNSGQLAFINKNQLVEAGLEIADLIVHLFGSVHPSNSNIVRSYIHSDRRNPPYKLRLYQAAIGLPFDSCTTCSTRLPAHNFDFTKSVG